MSELRTNRIIPRDGLPSGSSGGIIQVKSVTKTDPFDTLSTSYTDVLLFELIIAVDSHSLVKSG